MASAPRNARSLHTDPLHIPLIMCRGGPCGRPPVLIRVAARVAPTNCIFSSYYFESLYREELNMKVILQQDVRGQGKKGQMVEGLRRVRPELPAPPEAGRSGYR